MAEFVTSPPCLTGREARAKAPYWARKFQEMGHAVRLMSPLCVKPSMKTNKNDAADAEAICEAVARPIYAACSDQDHMAMLPLRWARQGFVKERTAIAHRIRGLLAEYGIAIPEGIHHITGTVADVLADAENGLPGIFRELLSTLLVIQNEF